MEASDILIDEDQTPSISDDKELIENLIYPSVDVLEELYNSTLSKDLILSNLDNEDYKKYLRSVDFLETLNIFDTNRLTFNSYKDAEIRRIKAMILATRGKNGFQNKLLKTRISINRVGRENEENPFI